MAGTAYDACHDPYTFVVLYDQPPLQQGDYLYKDSAGSARYTFTELQQQLPGSPNPFYLSNGSSVYTISAEGGTDYAKVALVGTCVPSTPAPSVTASPSRTPSVTPSKTVTPSPSVTPSVTPSRSQSPCYTHSLGFGATYGDACTDAATIGGPSDYYMENAVWTAGQFLYSDDSCSTAADAGYYSDGETWRYWNGATFTTAGDCLIYGFTPDYTTLTMNVSAISEGGVYPTYRCTFNIEGFKATSFDVQGVSGGIGTDTKVLIQTGTVTGNGTLTITRVAPDSTAADAGDIAVSVSSPTSSGISVDPSSAQTFTIGEVVNETFTISNLALSDDIEVNIVEG